MAAFTSEEIRTAIRSVLIAGQKYTLPGGRSVEQADLAELRTMLTQAEIEEARTARGAVFMPVGFGRPS